MPLTASALTHGGPGAATPPRPRSSCRRRRRPFPCMATGQSQAQNGHLLSDWA